MSQERIDNLFASESWTAVYTAFSNVSLKAYDFDTIREALINYVSETYPDKFNDFIASSEFIAVLDLVAYLGHSLSFRLDMNTRENFMDTAERRESILRMAKTLGYIKTRPVNARGFMKITSISTDQPIFDNEGNSLANRTINWNDSNNVDWYENFIDVINAALSPNSKIQDPMASMVLAGVENYLYEINERPTSRTVAYGFQSAVAGSNKRFEAVRTEFVDDKIQEAQPIASAKFTVINRNDNLGPASDRTGFFVYTKVGNLKFEDFSYSTRISNRTDVVADANISNSDVWIQKTDTSGNYFSDVTVVDNDTRETAIYNSLRNGSGDIASVTTQTDNSIQINYPDGVFGNAAYGNYRVWYRTSPNENFTVNRDDVQDGTISIPYVGVDGRNYRLTMSLESTRDFSENFAAESFTSVRRIAPRAYYAQDRMVNAQDYNVLPLSLGTNIVSKVKAVNTTFAGNSRYFEMDDVTGHHSNISITGTDGSVYIDDDAITMKLRFNRQNGSADDFIRNEMTKALRHPSLINKFFYVNKYNSQAVIDLVSSASEIDVLVDPTNPKIVEVNSTGLDGSTNPHLPYALYPGDFVKLVGDSDEEYWTQIDNATVGGGLSNSAFEVMDVIPERSAQITHIIRGYRTRFESDEIQTIKRDSIEDLSVSSFTLKYVLDPILPDTWYWEVDDGTTPLDPAQDIFLNFSYNPGIRENEAEYTVRFTGKKIVFESNDQVKFYYGNKELVVDNETNLAERDQILINYYDASADVTPTENVQEDLVTIGYAPLSNYTEVGDGATFDAVFQYTGAYQTLEFIQGHPTQMVHKETRHYLVSPVGIEYAATPELDSNGDVPIIGDNPSYTISFDIDDISGFVSDANSLDEDQTVEETTEYVYSIAPAQVYTNDTGNLSTSTSTITVSENDLISQGFKGEPSSSYFSSASSEAKFIWVDDNELPTGETIDTALHPMLGVQNDYVTQVSGSSYEFEFPRNPTWAIDYLDNTDNDIRWKQIAYAEINFTSTTTLTESTLLIKESNGSFISNVHWEMTKTGNDYKVVFWTYDPGIGSILDILIAGDGDVDLSTFSVRVEGVVDVTYRTNVQVQSYKDTKSYIYDEYLTKSGYVDYNKVKIIHMDADKNPHGILDIFNSSPTNVSKVVLETYTENNVMYDRVSSIAIASADSDELPDTTILWYNTESGVWRKRLSGEWTTNFEYGTNEDGSISYNDVTFKVVEGRSYVEDAFMSFRWDHFADIDKRIDPSTSNIIDVYVLGSDYVRRINEWVEDGFGANIPTSPNNFELRKMMESIEDKAAIADHVSYIPVKFKMLFGEFAEPENQAVFKVVKKLGTAYTDSEIKTVVAEAVNEYFALENWNFGEQFYFSELAAYLHSKLSNYISSVVVTPKFSGNEFTNLLSISSEPNEIFLSVVTSSDVKIISSIATNELTGE